MASVIRIDNLRKIYGKGDNAITAIDGLSLEVQSGQIYGFLGSNGAGKTTTIKILLSLIHATSGQAYLFDTPIHEAHDILQTKVGALVEEATFYPFMTGYDNLRVLAQTSGIKDIEVRKTLSLVGLENYAKRKTKTYSTGMKQRLGVASALLTNPALIILDEPTSGLDPKGIQDMRIMFQHLAHNEGKTIFLSSHLLHEIEQTCDHVAIIHKGKLVQEGTVESLVSEQSRFHIKATPIDKAFALLAESFSAQLVDTTIEINASADDIPKIIQTLIENEIALYEVIPKRRTLEDLFLDVTHD